MAAKKTAGGDDTAKKVFAILEALAENLMKTGKLTAVFRFKNGSQLVWFKEDVMGLAMKQMEDESKK